MKTIITTLLVCMTVGANAQTKKTYFPAWTYHQDSVNIIGLSVGISDFLFMTEHTASQGIKIALIGEGILAFAIPSSPICDSDSALKDRMANPVSIVNGMYLSLTGSLMDNHVNGIMLGGMAQYASSLNGLSASLMFNFTQRHNGILFAIAVSESYRMRGVQIGGICNSKQLRGLQLGLRNENKESKGVQVGIWNKSVKTTGVQIGIWNINEHRKMPLVNWSFGKADA